MHQEVTIPTSNEFSPNRSYTANVMIDNSNTKKDVIHIMLSKNQIIQAAETVAKSGQANQDLIRFALKPGSDTSNNTQKQMMYHGSVGSMAKGQVSGFV